MDKAMYYRACSVGAGGPSHATPVDGLWLNDKLYFSGSPKLAASQPGREPNQGDLTCRRARALSFLVTSDRRARAS